MLRNQAGQYFYYRAANSTSGVAGDEANHSLDLSIDGGARTPLTNSPTNVTGNLYRVSLTAAETDGVELSFFGTSSTGGVELFGVPAFVIYTEYSPTALENFNSDQVDTYVKGDQSIFRQLFGSAFNRCQRVAIIGDSREAGPGGTGREFIHRMNSQSYKSLTPQSETYIGFPISNSNNFILRTTNAGFAASTSYTPLDLPETQIGEQSTTSNGFLSSLIYDADGTTMTQPAWADVGEEWFPRRGLTNLEAEIYIWAHAGSPDQFRVVNRPNNDDQSDYFATPNGIQVFNEGLSSLSGWLTYTTSPLTLDPVNPYQQVEIHGWDGASRATGLVCGGMRWKDADRDEGITFQSFGEGGLSADDWETTYSGSYEQFKAYGPWDAIIIDFGVNDAAEGAAAATYKANVQSLIDMLRGSNWAQTSVPIILVSDLDRVVSGSFSAGDAALLASYPAELEALAAENENVVFVEANAF